MTITALTHSESGGHLVISRGAWILALLVVAWFLLILMMAADNVFVRPNGTPPLALLAAGVTPVVAFVAALQLSESSRALILNADLRLVAAIQAWRLGGYSFLLLYGLNLLPGLFAWPAGLGDMAIGLTAPLVIWLLNKPDFSRSTTFVVWNVLGILDLVVAVGLGALGATLIAGPIVPTRIMSELPLVLIPAFFVPGFVILHVIALFQARAGASK